MSVLGTAPWRRAPLLLRRSPAAGERLMQAVLGLRERGISLVLSSHDPVVTEAADGVVRLHDGAVA